MIFESTSTPDVYKRWAAFGLLSTHSRLHGSTSYRVPWAYDDEAVDVVRFFTKLKASLMPYLFWGAVETSRSGVPLMRSMVLEFTNDRNCHYLDRQYMLGSHLLCAPVFREDGIAEYYLPEGTWTNYLTGEEVTGGRWVTEKQDYLSIPLMVRENSILPIGACDTRADYDYAKDVEFKIYTLKGHASAEVYGPYAKLDGRITADKNQDTIKFITESAKPYSIRLVNQAVKEVKGAHAFSEGRDTVLMPVAEAAEILVFLEQIK